MPVILGGVDLFSIFKKASWEEQRMTQRSILDLHDKWIEKGYQKFYFKLIAFHVEQNNQQAANAALQKKDAIEKFLTVGLRSCNDSSFSNKKVQEMAFVRVSAILNSLQQIKVWANENDIPFKDLIED